MAWIVEEREGLDGEPVKVKQYVITTGRRWRTKRKTTYYEVIRVSNPKRGGRLYGSALRVQVQYLHKVDMPNRYRRTIARRRATNNARLGERGCGCQCCIHVAIPASMVKHDGTFAWEEEE